MGKRKQICDAMLALDASGMNRGASGNASLRDGDHMLITPSGVPPRDITPDLIARIPLNGSDEWEGKLAPSVEWHFHRDLLLARPDMNAVLHSHAPWCTVLAVARKSIPAVHYMMAAFGGPDIRCSGYARYGTPELATHVVAAMEGRNGCLMANHGMVVVGETLTKALWLAAEMEALAHQYFHASLIGGAHVLTEDELAETARGFASYGAKAKGA